MNKGKVTCEKLKAIRREVAEKLGIDYAPRECTFEGDCPGTCPLCQQETDVLMEQVNIRLQENPELLGDIQCKVSEMYRLEKGEDDNPEEVFEMGMPPANLLEGLVDIGDEDSEGNVVEDEPLEGEGEEPLMGDVPMMGIPPLPDYSRIAPFCKYYDPTMYWKYYPAVATDRYCLRKVEERICNAEYLWDIIFDADDPQLAFQELFVQVLYNLYPGKYLHLLQVFFEDDPTYKKQLFAKVMSIKKNKK